MPSFLPQRITRPRRAEERRSCPGHRAWVRRHHCVVPGCAQLPIECAHVRTGTDGGTGLKPSDRYVVSLCREHHAEQHRIGEARFENKYSLDLLAIAAEFARRSPHRTALGMTGLR
jgi:hypothetical protein